MSIGIKNPFPNGETAFPYLHKDCNKIKEYERSLSSKIKELYSEGCLSNFIFQFVENPKPYLIVETDSYRTNCIFPPYLKECACITNLFNRYLYSRRNILEKRFLTDTIEGSSKQNTLRYLSVGSGDGLQDFINLGKLMRSGFSQIEAVLVDPEYQENSKKHEGQRQGMIQQMDLLATVAKERGIQFKISFVEHVSQATGPFQVIQLIDFDVINSAFTDLMRAHQLLAENGKFYLSFSGYDLTFTQNACIHKQIYNSLNGEPERRELFNALKVKDITEPRIAMFGNSWTAWLQILPAMCGSKKVNGVMLTLLRPSKPFTEENMSRFLTLCNNKPVVVKFRNSGRDFIERAEEEEPHIVTHLFSKTRSESINLQVQEIRNRFDKSRLFFALKPPEGSNEEIDASWSWDPITKKTAFYNAPSESSRKRVYNLMEQDPEFCSIL